MDIVKEFWTKARLKPNRENWKILKLCDQCLGAYLDGSLEPQHTSLALDLVGSISLASSISWCFQHNTGFTCTASCPGLSGPLALLVFTHGFPCHIFSVLRGSLKPWGKSPRPLSFYDSKARTVWMTLLSSATSLG